MTDSVQQQAPPENASKWKLISFLLVGVLIPILASLLPWVLEHWVPENKLTYSLVGPISAQKAGGFELIVKNEGRSPQNNLEIWIPMQIIPQLDPKVLSDGRVELNEKKPTIILDTSTEPTKRETREGFTVLYYEKLRPEESLNISLFAIGGGAYLNQYELERMRIVSDNTLAQIDKPDEDLAFIFRMGTALFVLMFVLLFSYSIYYEKIMPVEKKRAELLKQMKKLDAQGAL